MSVWQRAQLNTHTLQTKPSLSGEPVCGIIDYYLAERILYAANNLLGADWVLRSDDPLWVEEVLECR